MPEIRIMDFLERVPGGLMLIPLVLGSIVATFATPVIELGNFTTALLADSALPLIALLILATGAQVSPGQSPRVLAKAGTVLLGKTIIPGLIIVGLGLIVGIDGFLGISILALLAAFENQNGGLWLALTGQYGDEEDRGAYIAAALNDGPFFTMVLIGIAGLGAIPLTDILAAIIPFLIGFVWGNVDPRFREVMKPVPLIVIPFFAFSLGAGIDLLEVLEGGLRGAILGILVVPITGGMVFLLYRLFLKERGGIGFAAGTTAGNALATPVVVAQADPTFEPYVAAATAQIGASILVSALLAPLVTSWVINRQGGPKDQRVPAGDIDGDTHEEETGRTGDPRSGRGDRGAHGRANRPDQRGRGSHSDDSG
jgi:2-keto-3-deoxygluconate permease